jgi:hypothetical protein
VAAANQFYFAEGSTLPGFDEFLLLANPNTTTVDVAVTYYFDDGSAPQPTTVGVPAQGRTTVDVPAVVGRGRTGVSIGLLSPRPIVAERSMYFDRVLPNGEINGAHSVLGAQAPRTTWSFAEGSTLDGLQEYLTVQNPGTAAANVTMTFGLEGGGIRMAVLPVPGGQRRTFDVNAAIGGGVVGHSTAVSSDVPVLVERPLYVNRAVSDDGAVINGGHVAFGTAPAPRWDFAEGTVLADFAEFLTLGNPGVTDATATITYFFSDGSSAVRSASVPAGSRSTVQVFSATDPAGVGRAVSDPVSRGVSVRVETSAPGGLVVERPLYFHHPFTAAGEVNDAHDVTGANALSTAWSFAEGSTLDGFYPFLTIENPNPLPATITITYTPDEGAPVTRQLTAAATSRLTVQAYGDPGQGGIGGVYTGFGMFVSSTAPVLVESPFYTLRVLPDLPLISGGADVIGFPAT